jgi:hypothetical protein
MKRGIEGLRDRGGSRGSTKRRRRGRGSGFSPVPNWRGTRWPRLRGVDAQRILKEELDRNCSLSSTYRSLHRINLSWLAPRPRHPQADTTAQTAFFATLPLQSERVQAEQARGKRVKVWFAGEAGIGQRNSLTRVWGQTGSRPLAPKDPGFASPTCLPRSARRKPRRRR